MNNKLFDQHLKSALDNLEAPYDSASWAALEQRLNMPFAEEQPAPVDAVDKAVFRTLERLEAPYQTAHWDILANRMTLAARRRRRIWITKLSEAAIFLLLLLNLDGLLESERATKPQNTPQPPASKHLQARASERGNDHVNLPTANESGSPDTYIVAHVSDGFDISLPSFIEELFENQGAAEPIAVSTPLFSPDLIDPELPESGASLPVFQGIQTLSAEQVQSDGYLFPTVQPVHVKAPKQHRFYAAVFANYDRNMVKSSGYSNASNGYGGGMTIGYRIGKWGAEAGLSYNRRHYVPKKVIEIYDGNTSNGFYGSFAKNVDADIVSVPVKVTRRIAQFGQTTVHAAAGVTTNFAVDKSYEYGSVFYPPVSPSGPNNPDPDQQPKLRKNGQGVFENGSLNGNVYASADVSVRVEQPVGRHIAAFVEPAYRLALGNKGIGPNPAKVNTFSVQAGLLTTL